MTENAIQLNETANAAEHTESLRVAVVDDDPMICRFLTLILESAQITVAAQASDGDQVVAMVQANKPDVVLMDIRMQRMSGIEATQLVKQLPNPPGVIALTSFDTESTILDAVAAGVDGFLSKDFAPQEIIAAVRSVAAGEGALSARAAKVVVGQVHRSQNRQDTHQFQQRVAQLTPRERDVTERITQGMSNLDIAGELFISVATVKTHLTGAMQKMGVGTRIELAVAYSQAQQG